MKDNPEINRDIGAKQSQVLLPIAAILTVLGAVWPVLFYEGSALGRYLLQKYEIQAIGDADFEKHMEAELYGVPIEYAPNPQKSERTEIASQLLLLRRIDRGFALICLMITAGLTFTVPKWPRLSWLYIVPALWLFANAHAIALSGGKMFAEFAVPAHATRWGMLAALAMLGFQNSKGEVTANWLLRITCSLTFAVHGYEAFQLNPTFQDLLYISAEHVGIEVSEWFCHIVLRIIGVMDFFLAVSVVAFHRRRLLFWMCCWGLITAASRPVTMGLDAWPEFAIRLPNSVAPLLVLILSQPALFLSSSHKTNSLSDS